MRQSLLMSLTLALVLGPKPQASQGTNLAAAQDDARAIIARAITAFGGEQKLNQYQAGRSKNRGILNVMNGVPFTQEVCGQLPGRFKEVMAIENNGIKNTVTKVFNGQQAWINVNGKTKELDGPILKEMKEAAHMIRVNRLTTLNDRMYELSLIGELKVDDRPVTGVRVSARGFRDVNLYFYKDDGLLALVQHRTVDLLSGKELTEQRVIHEYRDVGGLKSPKKITVFREGKKLMDVEVVEVQFLERLDDSEFAKP